MADNLNEGTTTTTGIEDSILVSIRQKLGPSGSYDVFDPQLIDFINLAFSRLYQLGIGPDEPFSISDASAVWSDFIPEGELEDIRTYVYLRVRILFDPPQLQSVLSAYQDQIKELEWELNALCD